MTAAALVFATCGVLAATDPKASAYYEDAVKRYQQGDMAGANIQLKNALRLDRNMLQAQLLMGKVLLESSDVLAAEVALREALRLGVSRAEVVLPLARALLDQSRPQDVLDDVLFANEGLPRETLHALLLLKAAAASEQGDHRRAFRFLEEAQADAALRADTHIAETPLRIRAGQFAEALAAANKAVGLSPQNPEAHYQLGTVHHAQSRLAPAQASYDRALTLAPAHQEALLSRAGLFLDLGKVDEAAKDLRALQALRPKDPRATYLRAQVLDRQGDASGARAALAEVTALLDPVPPAMLRYKPQLLMLGGLAHYGQGATEKAKPYLEGVQRLQGNLAANKLLAQLYLSEGNPERAVQTLEDYLRAAPRDLPAIELLAQAHTRAGRPARAVQLVRNAIAAQDAPRLRSALGIALLAAGQPQEALVELESAWARNPSDARTGAALSNLYLQRKELQKAQRVTEALVKRQPRNPGIQDLWGMVRWRQGDLAGARKAFETAAQLDPRAVQPRLNLARLDVREGQLQTAATRLGEVLKTDARNVEAMFELALVAERAGKPDQVVSWYTKAADVSQGRDLRAALALVRFHLRNNNAPAALKATERLAPNGSEDLGVLVASSRAYLANGDTNNARTLLTRATRVAGFNVDALVELAVLQLAVGNAPGATHALQKALSKDASHLQANAVLVDALLRQGDLDGAEKTARAITQRHPKRAIGPVLEGDVSLARRQAPAALAFFRRAHAIEPTSQTLLKIHSLLAASDPAAARREAERWLQAHPQDATVLRVHAGMLARSGQIVEARQAYEKLVAAAPGDPLALNDLANVMLRQKDAAALGTAEKALRLAPGRAEIIDTVAWAARAAGQTDRALQLLRDARLRAPQHPEIRFHLATMLAAAGRKAEARQELEPALRDGQWFESRAEAESLLATLN